MNSDSRSKILKRLKNIKTREENHTSSSGFNFLTKYNQPLISTFKEKLEYVNGSFYYCKNKSELNSQLLAIIQTNNIEHLSCIENPISDLFNQELTFSKELTLKTQCCITGCEYLIAQTGSAIVSTSQTHSRRTFAYPPIHIIVAYKNQLIGQIEEGLNLLKEKYHPSIPSQITTITGPSRTADIEKTLVLGAHGPKQLIIMYIDIEKCNN